MPRGNGLARVVLDVAPHDKGGFFETSEEIFGCTLHIARVKGWAFSAQPSGLSISLV